MHALDNILAWGSRKWEDALRPPKEASLYFANDSTSRGTVGLCLCSTPGLSDESLRVTVSRPGESQFDATLGYSDLVVLRPDATKPRHWLKWPSNVLFFGNAGGLMMAHLLGERSLLTTSGMIEHKVLTILTSSQEEWPALCTSTNVPMHAGG